MLELAEEVLRVGGDVRLADLLEELLDAPGLRQREPAPLPSAGGEDLGLPEQNGLHLLGVDLRERAVLEAHVAAPLGEAATELLLRDGDSLGFEREAEREPVDTARDARVRLERIGAHLHVDEIVRDEEVPRIGERADGLGPELDGVVAAGDEAHSVLVGLQAEGTETVRRLLLRGDVATDDRRALARGEAARARATRVAVVAVLTARLRGLHQDRRRHAVGANVDLDVLVGGAQRDARLGERAARAEAERRREVDDVGNLREIRELGSDLERDARQPLRDERRKVVDRLRDERRPHEAPDAAGRDAAIDRTRPALLRIDVPARAALEPTALVQRELPRVAAALERGLHEDGGSVGTQLEVEAGTDRLVAEAELHHLRLEDDASPFQERKEIGGVLAAHLGADPTRSVVLETRQQAERIAIGGRLLRLELEERRRREGRARIRIEQRDAQAARTHLHAVLDRLRCRGHRLGEPGVDAVRVLAGLALLASAAVAIVTATAVGKAGAAAAIASAASAADGRAAAGDPLGCELARAASSATAPADPVRVAAHAASVRAAALGPAAIPAKPDWRRRPGRRRKAARPLRPVRDRLRAVTHAGHGARAGTVAVGRGLRPRLLRPDLVTEGDEQRRHVLAMPVDLREGRAGALAREARRRHLELDRVRVRLGAAHGALRGEVFHDHVRDGLAPDVVVAAQKGAGAEEPPQRAVVELAQRLRERGGRGRGTVAGFTGAFGVAGFAGFAGLQCASRLEWRAFLVRRNVRKHAFLGALVTSEPHLYAAQADYHRDGRRATGVRLPHAFRGTGSRRPPGRWPAPRRPRMGSRRCSSPSPPRSS